MHTAWSARRTCIASVSAVECTATVWMPISWQARWMRSAISPRVAVRTLLIGIGLLDDDERLVELDRLAVGDEHLRYRAALGRDDRIHHLHRLDDQQRVAGGHRLARADERRGARLGGHVDGADHRRFDEAGMLGGRRQRGR